MQKKNRQSHYWAKHSFLVLNETSQFMESFELRPKRNGFIDKKARRERRQKGRNAVKCKTAQKEFLQSLFSARVGSTLADENLLQSLLTNDFSCLLDDSLREIPQSATSKKPVRSRFVWRRRRTAQHLVHSGFPRRKKTRFLSRELNGRHEEKKKRKSQDSASRV